MDDKPFGMSAQISMNAYLFKEYLLQILAPPFVHCHPFHPVREKFWLS